MSAIVECKGVWKRYSKPTQGIKEWLLGPRKQLDSRYLRNWALEDINFEIPSGVAFGILGHNGTGKSTLLSLLLGTIQADHGEVRVSRRTASLLELGAGFHPELTGRENIYLSGAIMGMTLAEINHCFDAIVNFSELAGAIENPIRTYSNGMIARLGFSTIIHTPAEILLIDEVLAVGDSLFQEKCIDFLLKYKIKGGTLVIVSHDTETLRKVCDVGMCMEFGKVIERGPISTVIERQKNLMQMSSQLAV